MQKLNTLDPFGGGRIHPGPAHRQRTRQAVTEAERTQFYDRLTDLCRLGETHMAHRLAEQNPNQGWQILDGQPQPRDT